MSDISKQGPRAGDPEDLELAVNGEPLVPATAPVLERRFTLRNEHGLHARTATQFVQLATRFSSAVEIEKDGQRQDGKSVVGVLMLLADKGSLITVRACGADAEQAIETLGQLIEDRFGERD